MNIKQYINLTENDEDDEIEKRAREFATKKHSGQTRRDGTPYIRHPERVAGYVEQFKKSHKINHLKAAAYLHDTLEDTETTYEELKAEFGELISSLVKELTSDKEQSKAIGKAAYLANKMKNMTDWGLVLKLSDRRDNVDDLKTADEKFRVRYKKETEIILDTLKKERKLTATQKRIVVEIEKKLGEV